MRRVSSRSRFLYAIGSAFALGVFSANGYTQESDAEALAKAAQNPVASMISLPFQNNTNTNFGPQEKTQNVLNIQPVWPFSVGENWNLITRTIFPVISQPALSPNGERTQGLGDITFSGFISPKVPGRWIWGLGGIGLLPSGDKALTADKWGVGPAAVALTFKGPWVYGGLINNVWSVSGSGPNDVNLMTLQPFVNYNLPGARYFTFSPIINAELGSGWQRAMDRSRGARLRQDFQDRKAASEWADQPLSQRGKTDFWARLATTCATSIYVSK